MDAEAEQIQIQSVITCTDGTNYRFANDGAASWVPVRHNMQ
jgi:hypothetical protein